MKAIKWEVVEHNWSDTSIYDQDGNVVCTMCIDDEDTTEENQEEREQIVSDNFKLIEAAPEMLGVIKNLVSDFNNLLGEHPDFEYQQSGYLNEAKELIKRLAP
jgi:hypothetical protein